MPNVKMFQGHKAITPPDGVSVWDVDPYADDILCDGRAFFDELRRKGPFVFLPKYGVLACGRYDVTREVFSDHERFVSSRGVGLSDFLLEEPWRPASIVLEVDPPYHTKTRRVIMRALSPKVVRDLKDAFRADAERLIDTILEKGEIDAVKDIAEAFPTEVFPKALGIKAPNRDHLIAFGAIVFNAVGPDNALRAAAMKQSATVMPWILEQCSREKLSDDGICATFYEAADAGEITEKEADLLVRSLLSAGVDTTVTGIGNALWCLATNPLEYEKLKSDPEGLALPAFEETLRFTTPVNAFFRTAAVDTSVAGIAIEEGSKILCMLGAANLDSDRGERADTFDISRKTAGHLALGAGVHVCVGQNIARAEGQALLQALAERVDVLELTGDPVWRPNNAVHGLDHLPMRLVPKR